MTSVEMEERLKRRYADAQVAVLDTTGTSDHFEVRIEASELKGLSRILQHKAIMNVFADELKTGEVHALTIRVL